MIGYEFFEYVGRPIISFYNITDVFDTVRMYYQSNAFFLDLGCRVYAHSLQGVYNCGGCL